MKRTSNEDCLHTALGLLSRRDHGSVELGRKLSRKGFATPQITSALIECKRLQYLDDRKFCDRIVTQQRRKGYGILRIAQILRDKGLDADFIDASLRRECCEMNQISDCRLALNRKLQAPSSRRKPDLTAHLYRFLHSRGFLSSIVRKVLLEQFPAESEQGVNGCDGSDPRIHSAP
jgi:regulatory protein